MNRICNQASDEARLGFYGQALNFYQALYLLRDATEVASSIRKSFKPKNFRVHHSATIAYKFGYTSTKRVELLGTCNASTTIQRTHKFLQLTPITKNSSVLEVFNRHENSLDLVACSQLQRLKTLCTLRYIFTPWSLRHTQC